METKRIEARKTSSKPVSKVTKKVTKTPASGKAKTAPAQKADSKPVTEKLTAKKPATASTKKAQPPAPIATPPAPSFDAASFQDLIGQTAYSIAQCRGFQGGDQKQDWETSEKIVENLFYQMLTRLPARR